MKRMLVVLVAMVLLVPAAAPGADFDISLLPTQEDFEELSREVGLGVAYQPLSPAEPMGVLGFDLGVGMVAVDIDEDSGYVQAALDDADPPSYFYLPQLRLAKGLPLGIDVGAMYAGASNVKTNVWGVEAKYALLKGSAVSPALSLRGSYTAVNGIDYWDLSTTSLELMVSKGFLFVTPYAGYGLTRIVSEPAAVTGLDDVTLNENRLILGAKFSLGFINLVAEANMAEVNSYALRLAMGI